MRLPTLLAVAAMVACCAPAQQTPSPPADDHPLSGLAAQRLVVTPAFAMKTTPDLPWSTRPTRGEVLPALDSALEAALAERGLRRRWVLPAELTASYRRNPTYATDPYELAEEPLRSPSLQAGDHLPDPLASQLRTLVALNDARIVLAPVEVRFEKAGAHAGRAVLRVVVVDARTTEARWVGEVKSEPAAAYGPVVTTALAARLVDLFVSP